MEPRVKYFLILNGIVFTLIILFVHFRRRKNAKLQSSEDASQEQVLSGKINRDYYKQTQGTNKDYKNIKIKDSAEDFVEIATRPVNVVFTWNGHDWDAYEVLGLPAGSTLEEVHMAYEKALAKVDDKSQDFIKKAYRSICQKVS
ncbi:MAG: hypothetical protein KDD58_15330 [Bdellovibrionales bacterium]|nr:hypothetical protein [Bdellovibrionales bacterium]